MRQPQARPLHFPLGVLSAEPFTRRGQWLAAGGVASAMALGLAVPATSNVSAMCVGGALALAAMVRQTLVRRSSAPAGFLVVDERGIHREQLTLRTRIVLWRESFGVTLLANRSQSRLLIAFTTRERTRYVGVELEGRAPSITASLFAHASTLADDDIAGVEQPRVRLAAEDASALLRLLAARAPKAFDRLYLTTARGEPVELDGRSLRIGERTIDLGAPLEHRSFSFHESTGRVAALYQATWVRQAERELVLMAPLPNEPSPGDDPPPREIRLAIDRLFLPPLRRAIERAPRGVRTAAPTWSMLREGRA